MALASIVKPCYSKLIGIALIRSPGVLKRSALDILFFLDAYMDVTARWRIVARSFWLRR
jgi:hypothetical protein